MIFEPIVFCFTNCCIFPTFAMKNTESSVMEKHRLFEAFSPVTSTQWKKKIIGDLKGKPYEKLITRLDEGFEVQPFYQKESLKPFAFLNGLPGRFPFVRGKEPRGGSRWLVNQVFKVKDVADTNREAVNAVANGADALTFVFDAALQPEEKNLQPLLQNVNPEAVAFHFRGTRSFEWLKNLQKIFPDKEKITGSVENDPLSVLILQGVYDEKEPFRQMAEKVRAAAVFPAVKSITVDGTVFHNAGGTTVSETACTLAVGSAYLQQLTDRGLDAGMLAGKMLFRMATGSDYFMEIAKYRAFRFLWAQILKAFGVDEEKAVTTLFAESSYRNKSVYDPYVNMLRTTTETMSAILGGVDAVTVLPFDAPFERPTEMARRIARNQQLILKEESYFDKVGDPAAGSYYIENLTASLIEKSWDLFLETDRQGGFIRAFEKGFVQDRIEKEARKKDEDIAQRKVSVLGVNEFPNVTEKGNTEWNTEIFEPEPVPKNTPVKPLRPYRAAAPFEKLRYAVDRYSQTHPRPRVWLLTLGDLALRRARAQFAENFFGCAGYEVMDNPGFPSAGEGIAAARKEKPEIVVLCADDKTYEKAAFTVLEALKKKTVVVLAGYPQPLADRLKSAGMEHFIHVRSNLLKELQKFNKILGVG